MPKNRRLANIAQMYLMADWGHTETLAPPLRARLDGTTFKLASDPHHKVNTSNAIAIGQNSGLEGQKRARDYLSPEIGDRWRIFRVYSHSH